MRANIGLRRMFRTTPILKALPAAELEQVAALITRRDYGRGAVIWNARKRYDYFGILLAGVAMVEYRSTKYTARAIQMSDGLLLRPLASYDMVKSSPITVYAASDVVLGILSFTQVRALRTQCPLLYANLAASLETPPLKRQGWTRWWVALMITIGLLVRNDLARIGSDLLYFRSEELRRTGDYTQALFALDDAIQLDSKADLAYNEAGYLRFQKGDRVAASTLLSQAVSINPNSGPALNNLAVARFSAGQLQSAIALQNQAVMWDANTAVVHYNRGMLLAREANYVEAIRAFKEATRINPRWSQPYLQLSSLYLTNQRYPEAERAARLAMGLNVTMPVQLNLAIALYWQGQPQEALAYIEQVSNQDSGLFVAKFYQALMLRDLGRLPEAATLLQSLSSAAGPMQQSRIADEIELIRHRIQLPGKP